MKPDNRELYTRLIRNIDTALQESLNKDEMTYKQKFEKVMEIINKIRPILSKVYQDCLDYDIDGPINQLGIVQKGIHDIWMMG